MVPKDLIAADPAEVGLDPERVEELLDRAAREVEQGLLPSAQVAIGRRQRIGGLRTHGDAADDNLWVIFSSTKAFVASAVWLLLQDGTLKEEMPVTEVVPEFATNGKDKVTLQHVMLHTAGFPLAPYPQPEWHDVAARRERFRQWRLDWEPGTKYQYHATSAHWVLADIIERVTKEDFRQFVMNRVTRPLGLTDFHLGVTEKHNGRVRDIVHVGERISEEQLRELGFPVVPEGEVTEEALVGFNDMRVRQAGVPGGGGIASAGELAMFYQYVMADLEGAGRLWDQGFLQDVMRVRTGQLADPFTKVPCNRALGVIIAGDDGKANWRGFGHTTSPRAFGHGGAGGQIGWGDPETGISLGYVTNGMDRDAIRAGRRGVGLSSRAGSCAAPAVAPTG